ncbi:unnamed protein product [Dracunculus medinensis]|uniref:LisH domain-containing protein n=1 Tax=Dracunculus medinensis TaxID=318479 RepID=A0A0N4ULA6_DRAME|nr:unnamed protein product [Dracunculus medinensis]
MENFFQILLSTIFSAGDNDIKEELSRLLNVLSSFELGRNYLLANNQGKDLLQLLIDCLKTKKLINYSCDNIIATLQKLSYKSIVQKELIRIGTIEWLPQVYCDTKINDYLLEYGLSLFINLSINSLSHSVIFRINNIIVNVFKKLLNINNTKICKYINGILYIIFGIGGVRVRAKENNFIELLEKKLNHCYDDSVQIPLIMKLLKRGFYFILCNKI